MSRVQSLQVPTVLLNSVVMSHYFEGDVLMIAGCEVLGHPPSPYPRQDAARIYLELSCQIQGFCTWVSVLY